MFGLSKKERDEKAIKELEQSFAHFIKRFEGIDKSPDVSAIIKAGFYAGFYRGRWKEDIGE